ncbi:MAG TPA: hypothetical protein VN628_16085 [Vicinamibacterales bacterium]|nr:hypothetical protein [Vicinamibacterales bacterium]
MNAILLAITGVSLLVAGFMSAVAWRMTREERRRSDARVAQLAEALYEEDGGSSVTVAQLLETARPDNRPRYLITMLAGICVVGALGGAGIFIARTRSDSPSRNARLQPSDVPLELLELDHEREGGHLIVRGVVRNPADSSERDGLSAVVVLVGHDGSVVASGRSALPNARLLPGATAPFVVTVSGAADIDRFRLSFRSDARLEPHVDRRTS